MRILQVWCSMKGKFSSQQQKDNSNVLKLKFLKILSQNLDCLNKLFELNPKSFLKHSQYIIITMSELMYN